MNTVLITGGTGLTGTALSRLLLSKGYRVIVLGRGGKRKPADKAVRDSHGPAGNKKDKELAGSNREGAGDQKHANAVGSNLEAAGSLERTQPEYATWDIQKGTVDRTAIEQADYIVHLAGAGVADKRWSAKRKAEIRDSRVKSGELLVKALKEIPNKVQAVIAASAIGWYGPDPEIPNPRPFIETDPPYTDFLGTTCLDWENSLDPVKQLDKRLVKFRTGIVLTNEGGAYPEFKRPVNFGIAPVLASGKQVVSWIHIDDLCNLYLRAIENDQLNGVYNAVAPEPVSNKALMLQIAKQVKGRFYLPLHVPAFAVKMMLGEMSIEVLKSTTVSAGKIRDTGFQFIYPTIEAAVGVLIKEG